MKATPFSLVNGCEAIPPLEIWIPSLKVTLMTEMTDEKKHKLHLQEVEELPTRHLKAQQQIEQY